VRDFFKNGGTTVANPSREYMTMAPDISCGPTSAHVRPSYGCLHTTFYFKYEYEANATRRLQGVMEFTLMLLEEAILYFWKKAEWL